MTILEETVEWVLTIIPTEDFAYVQVIASKKLMTVCVLVVNTSRGPMSVFWPYLRNPIIGQGSTLDAACLDFRKKAEEWINGNTDKG